MPVASKTSLEHFFTYCIDRNLPLAFYRLPDTGEVKIIAQKNSSVQRIAFGKDSINKKGFLFSPFQEDEHFSKIVIEPDIFCNEKSLPKLNFTKQVITVTVKEDEKTKLKETSRAQYENLVRKIKKEIAKGKFQKIIAARVLKKKKPENFSPVNLFQMLCKEYPHAFVSFVFTKEFGLWIGASPEILLSANKTEFKTYALAGTKANNKQNLKTGWGKKENEEHKIVSRYIAKAFEAVTKHKPRIKGPETVIAGNLLHLLTTFQYKSVAPTLWQKSVAALHPTPAVAGLPKQKAIDFILKNEKSSRSFYSGYLGPVNMDGETNLFVNLRCMNVLKNKLAIYVGCGITAGSVPAEEWKESKIKSQTLLNILK